MNEQITKRIIEVLDKMGIRDPEVVLDYPSNMSFGDLSTNVAMMYAKRLSMNPFELAERIKRSLLEAGIPEVKEIEVVKPGFVNFHLSLQYFSKNCNKKIDGKLFSGQKFFIDHTQPNPFKAFHIGHLMNNTIGESVARLIKANGGGVQTATYHGDVGLHIAMAVWAMKAGKSLEEAYAFGYKEYEENEKAKAEILEINKKIYEESDSEISKVYEDGRKKSLESFEALYKRLDSHFDFHFFESESGEIGLELVRENIGKIFEVGEGGAVIFKGENFEPKTHTRVFLNSEGLPTYEAKELGLAQIKKDWFEYDKSITVTANEQDSFFKVVEVAIGEVFPELKGKLKHLSHGMLKLPTGKMSSRTGTIISAEDLIEQVKDRVNEKIKDREFDEKEIDEVSEIVALGAIRYSILRQAIGGDIVFDFDKSISFEGDSGPYLQYSVVRANSIIKKAEVSPRQDLVEMTQTTPKSDFGVTGDLATEPPSGWETTNLERLLERFSSVVERSGMEYAPHYLVTYLTELAGEFNNFYARNKILDENDPTSPYKIYITKAFVGVMTESLRLLAIKVPERM